MYIEISPWIQKWDYQFDFYFIPFNVTIHIYTCLSIQYHGTKTIASKTMDLKTITSKTMYKKHAQNQR